MNLFKSFVNDLIDDEEPSDNTGYKYIDPDEQAAWEELNDYLNEDDSGSSSSSYNRHSYSYSDSTTGGMDSTLKQDFKNLGVDVGAPYEVVKKSYKNLLRQYHPDKYANDPGKIKFATEYTTRINASFLRIKKYYKKK